MEHLAKKVVNGLLEDDAPVKAHLLNTLNRPKAVLTPEEDEAWSAAFDYYLDEGKSDAEADLLAWEDLVREFPRLSGYSGIESWKPS